MRAESNQSYKIIQLITFEEKEKENCNFQNLTSNLTLDFEFEYEHRITLRESRDESGFESSRNIPSAANLSMKSGDAER